MAIMRARTSFTYWDERGVPHDIQAGQLVDFDRVGSELSKRKSLFDDVDVYVDRQEEKSSGYAAPRKPTVESATAAPGEKREVAKPAATTTTTTTASRPTGYTPSKSGK